MDVLVIGGNRFVGYQLVWRLLAGGHQVTVLNRGSRKGNLPNRVSEITVDRATPQIMEAMHGLRFDAVVDFAAFTGDDAELLLRALSPAQVGHYIVISTGQVYLVREQCPQPAKETDYVGPVIPRPTNPDDLDDWLYGIHKRDMEDVLHSACKRDGFPVTILRIPIVNGELDHHRRLESYFWRLIDGGPILLPDGGSKVVRPVYSADVASLIVRILGNSQTFGEAFNLCQDETPTVAEVIHIMANYMGARAEIRAVHERDLAEVGLTPRAISPLHTRWTSFLNPEKAKKVLGFEHQAMHIYLDKIVNFFLNATLSEPLDYRKYRDEELRLATRM